MLASSSTCRRRAGAASRPARAASSASAATRRSSSRSAARSVVVGRPHRTQPQAAGAPALRPREDLRRVPPLERDAQPERRELAGVRGDVRAQLGRAERSPVPVEQAQARAQRRARLPAAGRSRGGGAPPRATRARASRPGRDRGPRGRAVSARGEPSAGRPSASAIRPAITPRVEGGERPARLRERAREPARGREGRRRPLAVQPRGAQRRRTSRERAHGSPALLARTPRAPPRPRAARPRRRRRAARPPESISRASARSAAIPRPRQLLDRLLGRPPALVDEAYREQELAAVDQVDRARNAVRAEVLVGEVEPRERRRHVAAARGDEAAVVSNLRRRELLAEREVKPLRRGEIGLGGGERAAVGVEERRGCSAGAPPRACRRRAGSAVSARL